MLLNKTMTDRQNALNYDSLSKELNQFRMLPDDESFGKYVSKIIESKKITQAKLSDRTGVPKPTISRYLRDMEDNMKRGYVIAIVMALEISSMQIRTALSIAGVSVDYPIKRNQIIQLCLEYSSRSKPDKITIADCNLFLLSKGFQPLTALRYDKTKETDYESAW